MDFRIVALLAAFAFLSAAQQEPPPTSPTQSVVQVVAHSECASYLKGSGVVVAPGVVLTSAHVVQGTDDVKVILNGTTYYASAHILAPELDLCLLRVPSLPAPPVLFATESSIEANLKVQAIGFPRGIGPTITSGTVTGTWRFRGSQLVQSNAAIHPGSSGGGLFTPDGHLIGITTFVILSYDGLGFYVPASWIPELSRRSWQQGARIPVCRSREIVLQDFLEGMTEDSSNRPAWEAYSRAWVASRPKDPDAWFSLGYTLSQRASEETQTPTAVISMRSAIRQAYAKAVELNPAFARAWNNLGVIQDELGESKAATASFRMAVQLKSSFGLAWLNLGAACLNIRDYEEAARALKRGLEILPDEAHARARLSFCEEKLGHLDTAIRHMQTALRFYPMHMEWWLDLAQVCKHAKRQAEFEITLSFLRDRLPSYAKEISRRVNTSAP